MKILLDECVTKHLKPHLAGLEVLTFREMQWGGIRNGKLMQLCVEHGFDVLLMIDKNLQYQQNLDRYPVTIAVLNSLSSKLEDLLPFLPSFREQAERFEKHKAYLINK